MICIGEKLNGSIPAVAAAIAQRDAAFIRQRARLQAQARPDYLDVCASVDVSVEAETLRWMIELVEAETDIPISLDSPNPDALIAAMPFCSRPGLINSVSLEGDKLARIFPAIAGTEWRCVALLCDDNGIPATVADRLAVLDKIMSQAAAHGIGQERLFIDPLVTALCADPAAGLMFSACVKEIRARYPGVHILSGLSNISFGLPKRRYINQAFLILSMAAGMDSAIMDPTNEDLRALIRAADALLGKDENGLAYIGFIHSLEGGGEPPASSGSGGEAGPACQSSPLPRQEERPRALHEIFQAVSQGQIKGIEELVAHALAQGADPQAILNDGMIAAMTDIGRRFDTGEIFMPEMMMAARAMKKGVAALKPALAGNAASALGKVVLGTVSGDLHDIGKNLVGMMMESAGFELVDLGVDVPMDAFLGAVSQDPAVRIVGLSSLLTTSMPAMRETVAALSGLARRKDFFIMVGGAPVTQAFAQEIGADAYTDNAASAAMKARSLVEGA